MYIYFNRTVFKNYFKYTFNFLLIRQERHVVFRVTSSGENDLESKPSKLHRRDTPHHLKNKRIVHSDIDNVHIDTEKETAALAAVSIISLLLFFFFNNVKKLKSINYN